ncbi:MAG: M24 family metallopeptidase [Chlamydiae bacterium]|nr:M24 family metallopeptidase [Chlamydiota bacterium]
MLVPTLQARKLEIQNRLNVFQKYLVSQKIEACVLEDCDDLLYFTGLDLSYGRLWIFEKDVALLVDSRYIDVAKKESLVQPVFLLKTEEEKRLIEKFRPSSVQFDGSKTTVTRSNDLKKFLETISYKIDLQSKDALTSSIRMCKGACEIYDIKQSILILKKAFNYIKSIVKTGVTESDLSREFEIILREKGSSGSSFDPIIAFEKNASMPHYRPRNIKLKNNQMILFDIGCIYNHYRSDMTRIFFHGTPNPALLRIASLVKQSHSLAIKMCHPGVKIGDIDQAVRNFFREEKVDHLFTHSLGHGIGLQTHEAPIIRCDGRDKDLILQPGMVITIEPGLYLSDLGGVRIEDMILINDSGCENLTQKI